LIEVDDVARKDAHRPRAIVWLPGELVVRHALEHTARRHHFLFEFRQQQFGNRHVVTPSIHNRVDEPAVAFPILEKYGTPLRR
jgi:hypothetical protein